MLKLSIALVFVLILQTPLFAQNENNSDHSILLFGKTLKFDNSKTEILGAFPEFKIYDKNEMEFFGMNFDGSYEYYSIIKNNNPKVKEFDPFDSVFVIFLKFKNNILKEFEMICGHTQEGYDMIELIKSQFIFYKKEMDKELEYEKLYYKKNDLVAFYSYYETAILKIK